MTSKLSQQGPEASFLGPLHAVAMIAVVTGAAGSTGLMLRVGHRNNSRILLLLFGIWVLSPFVTLILANAVSKRWSVVTRASLYGLMLVLTLGSLAAYGDIALGPPQGEARFRIPCCSPGLMAAHCHRRAGSRVHIWQAVGLHRSLTTSYKYFPI
jgi:hypothetical protein